MLCVGLYIDEAVHAYAATKAACKLNSVLAQNHNLGYVRRRNTRNRILHYCRVPMPVRNAICSSKTALIDLVLL
jgi:hypothetical protein